MSKTDFRVFFVETKTCLEPIFCYKGLINLSTLLWQTNYECGHRVSTQLFEDFRDSGEFKKLITPEIQLLAHDVSPHYFHSRDTDEIYAKLVKLLSDANKPMTEETRARLDDIKKVGELISGKWETEKVVELVQSLTSFAEDHPDALIRAERRAADISGILREVKKYIAEEKDFDAQLARAAIGLKMNSANSSSKRARLDDSEWE